MNLHKFSQQVMGAMLVGLLLVGCGAPAATPTPIQPTETSKPTSEPPPETVAEFEVTFDGNDCTVSGPTELQAGEHTFIFVDHADVRGELWLVYLEDGKTFQDHLDGQSEPGEWYPKPSWVQYDSRVARESQWSNGKRVDTETWDLFQVGEHTILCYVGFPQLLWFAAPVMVVEPTSE